MTNVKKHFARKHAKKEHLPCPLRECGKILSNKFDFNYHLYARHQDLYQEHRMFLGWSKTSTIDIPGVFTYDYSYLTKVLDESGRRAWHCTLCPYTSPVCINAKKHFARKHAKRESLPCPSPGCGRILSNKFDYNSHLYEKHPDLDKKHRMYLGWSEPSTITISGMLADDFITKVMGEGGRFIWHCTCCGHSDPYKGNVKRHFARKHGPKERLPCPVEGCQKILTNTFDFNSHLYSMHPDLVQQYRIQTGQKGRRSHYRIEMAD